MMRTPQSSEGGPLAEGTVAPHGSGGVRTQPIRVVLADDSYLVREALGAILCAEKDIDLVADCADADSLLAAVAQLRPDVVVTDIRMPPSGDDEGIRVAAELRRTNPGIGVVVLSQYAEPRYALALLAEGSSCRAYLLKERVAERGELVGAIETVARGGSVIDSTVVDTLIRARSREQDSPLSGLTRREVEVLGLIAQGASNTAIGERLFLSKRAVEKHVGAIFFKLSLSEDHDVSRRVMAALIYLSSGERPGAEQARRLESSQPPGTP